MIDKPPPEPPDEGCGYRAAHELIEDGVDPEKALIGFMRCVLRDREIKERQRAKAS